jgi:hypothetical protein
MLVSGPPRGGGGEVVVRKMFFSGGKFEIETPKKNLPPPSSRQPWLALQGFYMLVMLVQFNVAYCVVKSFTSRQFCNICIGTVWFQVQFGKNMNKLVFQRLSKLYESEGRVQFEVFEKLAKLTRFSNCTRNHMVFQIARETILLHINNIDEKIMQSRA